MPNNIDDLYTQLTEQGAEGLGTKNQFRDFMQDKENTKSLHTQLTEQGVEGLGTPEQFEAYISKGRYNIPASLQQPQPTTAKKQLGMIQQLQQTRQQQQNAFAAQQASTDLAKSVERSKKTTAAKAQPAYTNVPASLSRTVGDQQQVVEDAVKKNIDAAVASGSQKAVEEGIQATYQELARQGFDTDALDQSEIVGEGVYKAVAPSAEAAAMQGGTDIFKGVFDEAKLKAITARDKELSDVEGYRGFGPQGKMATLGNYNEATRRYYEELEPDKVTDMLNKTVNEKGMQTVFKHVMEQSEKYGIDPTEYFKTYVAPGMKNRAAQLLDFYMQKEFTPRSDKEYILSGFSDSMVGMFTDWMTKSAKQNAYKQQALADYKASTGTEIARRAVGLISSAPEFMVSGGIASAATKKICGRAITNMVARGFTEAQARNILTAQLASKFGQRMAVNMVQGAVSGAANFGTLDAMSEAMRGVRDDDFSVKNVFDKGIQGASKGIVFGGVTGAYSAATAELTGAKKIISNLLGVPVNGLGLTASENTINLITGAETEDKPFFEQWAENSLTDLMMRATSHHNVSVLTSKGRRELGARIRSTFSGMSDSQKQLGANWRAHGFSEETEAQLKNITGCDNLRDVLEYGVPKATDMPSLPYQGGEVKAKSQSVDDILKAEARKVREQNWDNLMNNRDLPAEVKQQLAAVMNAEYIPNPTVTLTTVTDSKGNQYVEYRDAGGNLNKRVPLADADMSMDAQEKIKNTNAISKMYSLGVSGKAVLAANAMRYASRPDAEGNIPTEEQQVQRQKNFLDRFFKKDLTDMELTELNMDLDKATIMFGGADKIKVITHTDGTASVQYSKNGIPVRTDHYATAEEANKKAYDDKFAQDMSLINALEDPEAVQKYYETQKGMQPGTLAEAVKGYDPADIDRISEQMLQTRDRVDIVTSGDGRARTTEQEELLQQYISWLKEQQKQFEQQPNEFSLTMNAAEQPQYTENYDQQDNHQINLTENDAVADDGKTKQTFNADAEKYKLNEEDPQQMQGTGAAMPTEQTPQTKPAGAIEAESQRTQSEDTMEVEQPTPVPDGIDASTPHGSAYINGKNAVDTNNLPVMYQLKEDYELAKHRMAKFVPSNCPILDDVLTMCQTNRFGEAQDLIATTDLPADQKDALSKFVIAEATQSGMQDAMSDKIRVQQQQAEAAVQAKADEQGNVTIVTLDKSNKKAHIVKGDVNNVNGTVMVRELDENGNPTGNPYQIKVKQIKSVSNTQRASEMAFNERKRIQQELDDYYEQALNDVSFQPGKKVTLKFEGLTMQVTVASENADGTITFQTEDGETITVRRDEAMQMLSDAKQDGYAIALQYEADAYAKARKEEEAARKQAEEAEAKRIAEEQAAAAERERLKDPVNRLKRDEAGKLDLTNSNPDDVSEFLEKHGTGGKKAAEQELAKVVKAIKELGNEQSDTEGLTGVDALLAADEQATEKNARKTELERQQAFWADQINRIDKREEAVRKEEERKAAEKLKAEQKKQRSLAAFNKPINDARKRMADDPDAMEILDENNREPRTLEEAVADLIPQKGLVLKNWTDGSGVERLGLEGELGVEASDLKKLTPFIGKVENGATDIKSLAKRILENLPESIKAQAPDGDRDVRDVLIKILSEAQTADDIIHFIDKARIREAEAIYSANAAAAEEYERAKAEHTKQVEDETAPTYTAAEDPFAGSTGDAPFSFTDIKTPEDVNKHNERARKQGGLVLNEESIKLERRTANLLDTIGRQLGRTIEVDPSLMQLGANGQASADGKTLFLSPKVVARGDQMVRFITGHELTHLIKKGDKDIQGVWNDFKKTVQDAMGDEFARIYDEKAKLYKDRIAEIREQSRKTLEDPNASEEAKAEARKYANLRNLSKEQIEEEVICDFIGDKVLTDEEFVKNMIERVEASNADSASICQRMRNFIDKILTYLKSLKNPSNSERKAQEALERAKDIWSDMYELAAAKQREKLSEATNAEEAREAAQSDSFSLVEDKELLDKLDKEKTVTVYRAMQLVDGKLYPPMAAAVDGKMTNPIELGRWEQSDERPDLAVPDIDPKTGKQKTYKDGTPAYKFKLDKGTKDDSGEAQSTIPAGYNPYIHTSRSPLNDQFSSAWKRGHLVTVKVEVPESELTSGYRAEKSKDAVGEVEWKSGGVSGKLAKTGNPRRVILSRYDKPVEIVPTEEVAKSIAKMLEGTDIEIPFNVVNSELREALVKEGVKIGEPEKGSAGKAAVPAYQEWKASKEQDSFSFGNTSLNANKEDKIGSANSQKDLKKEQERVDKENFIVPLQQRKVMSWTNKKGIVHKGLNDYLKQLEDALSNNSNSANTLSIHDLATIITSKKDKEMAITQTDDKANDKSKRTGRLTAPLSDEQIIRKEILSVKQELNRRKDETAKFIKEYNINKDGSIDTENLTRLFKHYNTDEDTNSVFKRLMEVLKKYNDNIFIKLFDYSRANGAYFYGEGDISYDIDAFIMEGNDNLKANNIVHELTHRATRDILRAFENPATRMFMTPKQRDAAHEMFAMFEALHNVYPKSKIHGKWVYGLSDVYEMVSELGNPDLREALESVPYKNTKKTWWQHFKDCIKDLLGIKYEHQTGDNQTLAATSVYDALDRLLDGFSNEMYFVKNMPRRYFLEALDPEGLDEERSLKKNIGKSLKSINAKNIGKTDKQKEQEKSESFKKWFGDWEKEPEKASKVVYENGEPLIVYHGASLEEMYVKDGHLYTRSTDRFNTFKSGQGFFTSDKEAAETFGSKRGQYAVYLNMKKPFVFDCHNQSWDEIQDYANEDNYKYVTTDYIVKDIMRKGGYDGVILKNVFNENSGVVKRAIDDYIPFESNQIKSATDNNGDFDAANDDIRFAFEDKEKTDKQKEQEKTPEFKAWFGDWEKNPKNASKVVNKKGEPLVVYHGTLADNLTRFDPEMIGSRYSYDEKGFFFTSRENIANDYATSEFDKDRKGKIIPVYLNLRKPLIVDKDWCLKNGLGNPLKDMDAIEFWDNYQSLMIDESRRNDGIIIDDGQTQMYVAFKPNQIKSATDNNGKFDVSNDDIRFSFDNLVDGEELAERVWDASPYENKNLSAEGYARMDLYENAELADAREDIRSVAKIFNGRIGNASAGAFNYEKEGSEDTVHSVADAKKAGQIGRAMTIALEDYKNRLQEVGSKYEGVRKKVFDDAIADVDKAIKWYTDFANGEHQKIGEHADDGIRFSFGDLKQDKTLAGVHNLTMDKLRKAMRLGGLANPSVAIVDREKHTHDEFGDVSLILPSNLIDSRTGRNAGTWTHDVWTPIYPKSRTVFTSEGRTSFVKMLNDSGIDEGIRGKLMDEIDQMQFGAQPNLAYLYLKSKGVDATEYKHPDLTSDWVDIFRKHKTADKLLEAMKTNEILSNKVNGATQHYFSVKFAAEHPEQHIVAELNGEPGALIKAIRANRENMRKTYGVVDGKFSEEQIREAFDEYKKKFRSKKHGVDDYWSVQNAYYDVYNRGWSEDYENWLDKTLNEHGVKTELHAGVDRNGNSKYVPDTVQNASRIMNESQKQTGGGSFGGWGTFIAQMAKHMKTLSEIRERKSMLGNEDNNEDAKYVRENFSQFPTMLNEKNPDLDLWDGSASKAFADLLKHIGKVQEYAKRKYGIDLSEDEVEDIKEYYKAFKRMPVDYFETKFNRPVSLNEFASVIIPKNAPADVIQTLEQNGLKIYKYDPKKEGDREKKQRKAMSDDEVSFSFEVEQHDPFYSNAAKAITDIKQEKGTGDQWLAMIKKNGGLKAEEDKWMGLSDWLNGKKTVTKEEIQNFVKENSVKVEDVPYTKYDSEEGKRKLAELRKEFEEFKKTMPKNEDGRSYNDVKKELDDYSNMLYDKYGAAFSLHLTPEEQAKFSDLVHTEVKLRPSVWKNDRQEGIYAFRKMVEKYGEDFENGFHVQDNQLYIEADEALDIPNEAAMRVMGMEESGKNIAEIRLEYTTRGVQNPKEIALVVPNIEPYKETDTTHFGDAGNGRAVAWIRFGDATDIDGKKVLVIDEVQSKRHQDGREKGYQGDIKLPDFNPSELELLHDEESEMWKAEYNGKEFSAEDYLSEYDAKRIIARDIEAYKAQAEKVYGVPDAPFQKNWHELAMKRMLRYAAENGYDKVAWTTGKQQTERYNLGGVVKSVEAAISVDGDRFTDINFSDNTYVSLAHDSEGNITEVRGNGDTEMFSEAKNISEVVGRELSDQILSQTERGTAGLKTYSGENLAIGKNGMQGFYDQMLPRFMDKYGKKWGVKTSDVRLDLPNEADQVMHAVDVTDAMKESVMEGQPMFSFGVPYNKTKQQMQAETDADIARQMNTVREGDTLEDVIRKAQAIRESDKLAKLQQTISDNQIKPGDSFEEVLRKAQTLKSASAEADSFAFSREERARRAYEREKKRQEKAINDAQKELRKKVVDQINFLMNDKHLTVFNKSTLSRMLKDVQNADANNIQEIMTSVRTEIDKLTDKSQQRQIEDLMKLKTQDTNGKGMSIAKNVSDSVRRTLDMIRGRIVDLKATGYEEDMTQLRRQNIFINGENKRLENQIYRLKHEEPTDERTQEQIDAEIAEAEAKIAENLQKKEANLNELAELKIKKQEAEAAKALTADADVTEEINELMQKMDDHVAGKATWTLSDSEKLTGLQILKMKQDADTTRRDIAKLQSQLEELEESLASYKREARRPQRYVPVQRMEQLEQQIASMKETIEQATKNLIGQNGNIIDIVKGMIEEGKDSLLNQIENEKNRKFELLHGMLGDIQGKKRIPTNIKEREETHSESKIKKLFAAQLHSFEYLAKRINENTLGEDGWFYNYFVKGKNGVMQAESNHQQGLREAVATLDEKAQEIYGKKFADAANESATVENHPGVFLQHEQNGMIIEEEIPLSRSQAMYLYMVWKMPDGKMKLQLQGFTDLTMSQIEEFLDQKDISYADWIQDEFLKDQRAKYNDLYLELYHTSMANIENYVPLKIVKDDVQQDSNLSEDTGKRKTLEERAGSLINRRFNTHEVNWTMGAFDVIAEHVNQMEEWHAFARVRKDLDYILSNTYVRNQLDANSAGRFNQLYDAAAIAAHAYTPDKAKFMDDTIGWLTKGIVGGNIAYRYTTAMKQILSVPAFYGYSQDPRYLIALTKNIGYQYTWNSPAVIKNMITCGFSGKNGFKLADEGKRKSLLSDNIMWCLKNVPSFRNRVLKGTSGLNYMDEKMKGKIGQWIDKYLDYGMATNQMIDAITCSIGIKSIYDYKYGKLAKAIEADTSLSPEEKEQQLEEARRTAIMDADIYYNATQQSNHAAFMAPMQLSRSMIDRALSVYQNASIGYARRAASAGENLLKMDTPAKWKKLQREYATKFMNENEDMDYDEAMRQANSYLKRQVLHNAVGVGLYGIALNWLWDWGGRGLLGFFQEDEDEKEKRRRAEAGLEENTALNTAEVAGKIAEWSSYPLRGLTGMNITSAVINGNLSHPLLFWSELDEQQQRAKKYWADEDYAAIASQALFKGLRIAGFDARVWFNITAGTVGLADAAVRGNADSDAMISLMLALNTPNSNRRQVAETLYKDYDRDTYVRNIMYAAKYTDNEYKALYPGMKLLTAKNELEIYKEFELNHLSPDEFAKLKSEQKEMLKHLKSVDELQKAYDEESDPITKNAIGRKLIQVMKAEQPKTASTADELAKKAKESLLVKDVKNTSYISQCTSNDVVEDEMLKELKAEYKPVMDDLNELKYNSPSAAEEYAKTHMSELRNYKEIDKYMSKISELKGKMEKTKNPEELQTLMKAIRDIRGKALGKNSQ